MCLGGWIVNATFIIFSNLWVPIQWILRKFQPACPDHLCRYICLCVHVLQHVHRLIAVSRSPFKVEPCQASGLRVLQMYYCFQQFCNPILFSVTSLVCSLTHLKVQHIFSFTPVFILVSLLAMSPALHSGVPHCLQVADPACFGFNLWLLILPQAMICLHHIRKHIYQVMAWLGLKCGRVLNEKSLKCNLKGTSLAPLPFYSSIRYPQAQWIQCCHAVSCWSGTVNGVLCHHLGTRQSLEAGCLFWVQVAGLWWRVHLLPPAAASPYSCRLLQGHVVIALVWIAWVGWA